MKAAGTCSPKGVIACWFDKKPNPEWGMIHGPAGVADRAWLACTGPYLPQLQAHGHAWLGICLWLQGAH